MFTEKQDELLHAMRMDRMTGAVIKALLERTDGNAPDCINVLVEALSEFVKCSTDIPEIRRRINESLDEYCKLPNRWVMDPEPGAKTQ